MNDIILEKGDIVEISNKGLLPWYIGKIGEIVSVSITETRLPKYLIKFTKPQEPIIPQVTAFYAYEITLISKKVDWMSNKDLVDIIEI